MRVSTPVPSFPTVAVEMVVVLPEMMTPPCGKPVPPVPMGLPSYPELLQDREGPLGSLGTPARHLEGTEREGRDRDRIPGPDRHVIPARADIHPRRSPVHRPLDRDGASERGGSDDGYGLRIVEGGSDRGGRIRRPVGDHEVRKVCGPEAHRRIS